MTQYRVELVDKSDLSCTVCVIRDDILLGIIRNDMGSVIAERYTVTLNIYTHFCELNYDGQVWWEYRDINNWPLLRIMRPADRLKPVISSTFLDDYNTWTDYNAIDALIPMMGVHSPDEFRGDGLKRIYSDGNINGTYLYNLFRTKCSIDLNMYGINAYLPITAIRRDVHKQPNDSELSTIFGLHDSEMIAKIRSYF